MADVSVTIAETNVKRKGKRNDGLAAEMHALHESGISVSEIARRYNRSNSTVRYMFVRRGWNINSRSLPPPPRSIAVLEPPVVPGVEIRHVPKWPGYAVGSDGSVWSCRITRSRQWQPWSRMATLFSTTGYHITTLCCGRNRIRRSVGVHILVLETFSGPRPFPTSVARHLDGNCVNNSASNLKWGTQSENCQDRHAHGTDSIGEKSATAKLTASDVEQIRGMAASQSQASIAKCYGVHPSTISLLLNGKSWVPKNASKAKV